MAIDKNQIDRGQHRVAMVLTIGHIMLDLFERVSADQAGFTGEGRKAFRTVWVALKDLLLSFLADPLAPVTETEFTGADATVAAVRMREFLNSVATLDRALARIRLVGDVDPLTGTAQQWTADEWKTVQTKLGVVLQAAKTKLVDIPG